MVFVYRVHFENPDSVLLNAFIFYDICVVSASSEIQMSPYHNSQSRGISLRHRIVGWTWLGRKVKGEAKSTGKELLSLIIGPF